METVQRILTAAIRFSFIQRNVIVIPSRVDFSQKLAAAVGHRLAELNQKMPIALEVELSILTVTELAWIALMQTVFGITLELQL